MSRPATRSELLDRMDTEFDALLARVDQLDAAVRDAPGACLAWSIKDLMAHLDAWHELVLTWEQRDAPAASRRCRRRG